MRNRMLGSAALALVVAFSASDTLARPISGPVVDQRPSVDQRNTRDYADRYVGRSERPLTVMGMTGGIEPKYPLTTGSVERHPVSPSQGW